mgnify:CR=1 FL=1
MPIGQEILSAIDAIVDAIAVDATVDQIRALVNTWDMNVGGGTLLLYSGGVGELQPGGLREFKAVDIANALADGASVKTIEKTEINQLFANQDFREALDDAILRDTTGVYLQLDSNGNNVPRSLDQVLLGKDINGARLGDGFWDDASRNLVNQHTGDFRMIMPDLPGSSVAALTEIPALLDRGVVSGQKVNGIDLADWQAKYVSEKALMVAAGHSTADADALVKAEINNVIEKTSNFDLADLIIAKNGSGDIFFESAGSHLFNELGLPAETLPAGIEGSRISVLDGNEFTGNDLKVIGKYADLLGKAGLIGDVLGTVVVIALAAEAYDDGNYELAGEMIAGHAGGLIAGFGGGYASAAIVTALLATPGVNVGVVAGMVIVGGVGFLGAVVGGLAGEEVFRDLYHDLVDLDIIPDLESLPGLSGLLDDYAWAIGEGVDSAREALSAAMEDLDNLWDLAKDALPIPQFVDPLILDLDGNGVDLAAMTGAGSVYWNTNNDDFAERSGWISGNDGFLAIDLNSDGVINDQSELFGSQASDGFAALGAYDSNADGVIDASDTEFANLLVWVDVNSDGVSDAGELHTLTALNITSISLNTTLVDYDIAGNNISHESSFVINGQTNLIVDAWLQTSHIDTAYIADYTLDVRTLFLPTLRGYGAIKDLHITMSMDENLLNMVSEIATADTTTLFSAAFDVKGKVVDLLYKWAGVDLVAVDSRGTEIDARTIEFMEEFFGEEWVHNNSGIGSTPNAEAGEDLELVFDNLTQQLINNILVQTNASSFYGDDAYYDINKGSIENSTFSTLTVVGGASEGAIPSGANDLYVVSPDSGDATILEGGGADNLWFAGVSAEDIRFERVGYDLKIHHPNGVVTVTNQYKKDITANDGYFGYELETLTLEDGTVIDLLSNMIFEGTTGDDSVYGLNKADVLYGFAGNDSLRGEGGNDVLNAGAGNDSLTAGTGDDVLIGGTGDDVLAGSEGNDIYEWALGDGNDTIYESGYSVSDVMIGGDDVLKLHGVTVDDIRFEKGTSGSDHYLNINIGSEVIHISRHFDYQIHNGTNGFSQFDNKAHKVEIIELDDGSIIDLTGDFTFTGTALAENVYGLEASGRIDTLMGLAGDDVLDAGAGNDILIGGAGNDDLRGDQGNDTYEWTLGDGNDTISESGYLVSQVMIGGDDVLKLHGVTADDISFEKGNNSSGHYLNIIIGSEVIQIIKHFDYQIYNGSNGFSQFDNKAYKVETIELDDGSIIDLTGDFTFTGTALAETISGLDNSSRIDTLMGLAGDDLIDAGAGNDILIGGTGNDDLRGDQGNDIYEWTVGDGNDTILESGYLVSGVMIGGDDVLKLHGVTADDVRLEQSSSNSRYHLNVNIGSEVIQIINHFDYQTYYGTNGYSQYDNKAFKVEVIELDDGSVIDLMNNITFSGSSGVDHVKGLDGGLSDTLRGFEGADTLTGYSGDDILDGGAGADTMTGGSGADVFILSDNDIVNDYSKTQNDVIDLTDILGANFNPALHNIVDFVQIIDSGADSLVQVDIDGGADNFVNVATLKNVTGLNDESLLFDNGHIIIRQAGNTDPVANNDNFTTNEDMVVNGNLLIDNGSGADSDADGHALSVRSETVSSLSGGSVIIANDGSFTYTPAEDYNGTDSFSYRLLDSYGGHSIGTAYVTLNAVNDDPKARDDNFAGSTLDPVHGNLNADNGNGIDHDPEGDSFTTVSGTFATVQGGSITIQSNGDFTYTAATGFTGADSYSYSIQNAAGATSTALANFQIEEVAYNLVTGTAAAETLNGTTGQDLINGHEGNDVLQGSSGDDRYEWSVGDGSDTILENLGLDKLVLHGVTADDLRFVNDRGYGDLKIHIGSEVIRITDHFLSDKYNSTSYDKYQVESILLDDGSSIDLLNGITLEGTSAAETVYGLNASDVIHGYEGNDIIYGYSGDDFIIGGLGNDNLQGSVGNDSYEWSVGDGSDTITENLGLDKLVLHGVTADDLRFVNDRGYGDLKIHIGSEVIRITDHFLSDKYNSTSYDKYQVESILLDDGSSIDLLNGLTLEGTSAAETVYGLNVSDLIYGYEGNDNLYGYSGDDVFHSGTGADKLWGAGGADTYVFDALDAFSGIDEVMDFNLGHGDKLDLSGLVETYDPVTQAITDYIQITTSGANSIVSVDTDGGADNFVQVATLTNITGLTDEDLLVTDGTLII